VEASLVLNVKEALEVVMTEAGPEPIVRIGGVVSAASGGGGGSSGGGGACEDNVPVDGVVTTTFVFSAVVITEDWTAVVPLEGVTAFTRIVTSAAEAGLGGVGGLPPWMKVMFPAIIGTISFGIREL